MLDLQVSVRLKPKSRSLGKAPNLAATSLLLRTCAGVNAPQKYTSDCLQSYANILQLGVPGSCDRTKVRSLHDEGKRKSVFQPNGSARMS